MKSTSTLLFIFAALVMSAFTPANAHPGGGEHCHPGYTTNRCHH